MKDNLVSGILATACVLLVGYFGLRFFVSSLTTNSVIVNDTDKPMTVRLLHDDGDNSQNKSLTEPIQIDPLAETDIKIYGGAYCLFHVEEGKPVRSWKLTRPLSVSQGNSSKSTYLVSKLDEPCEYQFESPHAYINR